EAATREREAGRHAEAAALLERAVEEPCPPGDRAAACAELWLARGHQRLADGDPAGARQAFAAGLDHVGDAPGTPLERELHAAHAAAEAFALAGMPDDELDRALTPPSGRQSGRDRSMRAHAAIIGARSGALPAERALELARWAIDGGALVAEDGVEAPAFSLVTATLHFVDALEESVALCTAALADAEARGSAFGAALARYLRAAPLLRLARLDEMRRDATAAAAGFPPDEGIWRYGADRLLALAALEEGDVAAAVELATRRMEDARAAEAIWAIALQTRATVRLAAGDLDGALADANEVGALVADTADNPNAGVGWRSIAARALTVLGERTEAVRLARAELRIARRFGAAGGIGVALVTLGIAERDRTTSLRALAEAVDVLAHSDCRLDACAARVELGAALRRAGRRGDARAPLTAALDVAERHGLVMLRDRAEHELRAAGARPRRRALAGVPSLTPSEERIARLAASGRSNPAIAAELFVSRKTVEYHLSNAYRKLGVRGRDGLAAALAGEPAV
ncbi:MAG TPA: LuxR C-terminal-related transcriptional regulator, partial [Capillimicrobium sp.]|nr:LuxR C-terminal-related transcriptional regulator [Capillimicrobium sp.]